MSRIHQNPRTAGRVIDGLAFVVTPDDHKVLTLNHTAARIWELAEAAGGVSLDEIADALAGGFQVTRDRARADAERAVEDLVQRGVLEVRA